MKNLIILLSISIMFFIAKPTYAQSEGHKVGGIRAGWNYSQYFNDGNALLGTEDYSSFYVGVYRDTRIVPMFHFGTGIEYYQNAAFSNDNNKRVLHYIGLPLYLKFKIGPVFALSGFEPSFKVGEKYTLLGQEVNPTESANWFDAPFFLGAGVKVLFITVDIRYNWGTIDAFGSAKSQYLQLGGAISF